MQGWIALHRCLTEKAIWQNSSPEHKTILITLLLMANHKGKQWEWNGKKFEAKPGQFVTSIESIRKKAGKGISTKNVRSALKRFEKLGFLANETAKTGRLITILNWATYQTPIKENGKENGKEGAKRWQRGGKEVATNNNDNNNNNNNNIPYVEIIDFLNAETGKKYKHTTKATRKKIQARWNEGFRLEDFKTVIKNKAAKWKDDPKMEAYLRPETLFSNKFESYLNEKVTTKEHRPKETLR